MQSEILMSDFKLPVSTKKRVSSTEVTAKKVPTYKPEVLVPIAPNTPQDRGLKVKGDRYDLNLSEEGTKELFKEGIKGGTEVAKGLVQVWQTYAEIKRIHAEADKEVSIINAKTRALKVEAEKQLATLRETGEQLKSKGAIASEILKETLDRLPVEDRVAALPEIQKYLRVILHGDV